MNENIFVNIYKIIERESKFSTYKFALLRGVIDIIQENSPYIRIENDRAFMPLGLMIEKWILYYYPILASLTPIPQINGETKLAFVEQFKKVIIGYTGKGEFSVFYNDLKSRGMPDELKQDFLDLANKLNETIIKMPMRYIGNSLNNNDYSIFHPNSKKQKADAAQIDIEYLIKRFGDFSIPYDYFKAFQLLGSFINGKDSILVKWAEFSVNASGKILSIEKVMHEALKSPITEREILESKKLYQQILNKQGKVYCVWTGKALSSYDIDHMIPFSIWKNNDLWNLLPALKTINNKKRDKIPAPQIIEQQKDLIIYYWELINTEHIRRFQKEMRVSLLGNNPFTDGWQNAAINQLMANCNYLINNRGYELWAN
jgi:hypothetical protein